MTKLFHNFQGLLRNRPRFNIKYVTMECPEIIVKIIMGKQYKKPDYDIYFGDDYLTEPLKLKH